MWFRMRTLWALGLLLVPAAAHAQSAGAAKAGAAKAGATQARPPGETTRQQPPRAARPVAAARPVSIADALRLGEARSDAVKASRASLDRATAQVSSARSAWFPQIAGDASYQRTIKSEYEDVFSMFPSMGGKSTIPFGAPNTYRLGLSGSETLFNGGARGAQIDLAKLGRDQAKITVAQSRALAVLNAAQAYYDAVLSQRLVDIAKATLAQAQKTLAQTRLAFQKGAQARFDVLRAEVARDNQRSLLVQQRSNRDLALLQLKQTLYLPTQQPIALTSALDVSTADGVVATARKVAGVPAKPTPAERSAIQLADLDVKSRQSALDLTRAARWPTIQLVSQFGIVNYPQDLLPPFDEWRTNFTVGVQLSVPLFTGGKITSEIRSAEADVRRSEAVFDQTEKQWTLALERARQQVDVARALWKASLSTVTQARRAYQIATLRYQQGVSTQLELNDARVQLELSQADQARAARNLLVARVQLALLPRLPLTQAGAAAAALAPSSAAAAGAAGGQSAAAPSVPTSTTPAGGGVSAGGAGGFGGGSGGAGTTGAGGRPLGSPSRSP